MWQGLVTFLVVTGGEGDSYGCLVVESRDAANISQETPTIKNSAARCVRRAEVEPAGERGGRAAVGDLEATRPLPGGSPPDRSQASRQESTALGEVSCTPANPPE